MEEERKPLMQEDTTLKKETRLSGFFKLNEDEEKKLLSMIMNSSKDTELIQHPLIKNVGDSETPIYMIMKGMIVTDDGVLIHFFPVYQNAYDTKYLIGSAIEYDELPNECRSLMTLNQDFENREENVTYSEYDGNLFLHYEYGARVLGDDIPFEYYLRLINLNSKTLIQLI